MVDPPTLRELFEHGAWARDQILAAASTLSDEQLDRSFEIGPGSFRRTLWHIVEAERLWNARCRGEPSGSDADPRHKTTAEIGAAWREQATARCEMLARESSAGTLTRIVQYKNMKGQEFRQPLDELMLHVANHATHHRAQLLNMLRRLGAGSIKPGLDFIFWKRSLGGEGAPFEKVGRPALEAYFAYGDWATDRVIAAARRLPDAALDQKFEMGLETIRNTIRHVHHAEWWWFENWNGRAAVFPKDPDRVALDAHAAELNRFRAARDQWVAARSDADLQQLVAAEPRPGMLLRFPLGVTLLQLCTHGTHHRAQALNMLRHAGGEPPALDLVIWSRERAGLG